jgi:hypothetical protein
MNSPLINIDPNGLDCVSATNNSGGYSVKHDSNSGACGKAGGTWVPGYVDESWVHFNSNNGQYQVGSFDGGGNNATVDYDTFAAGAQTDANGNCTSGCGGYGFASANANWLQGMLAGNSSSGGLGGMIQFMVDRDTPIHGVLVPGMLGQIGEQMLSGPLDFWNDHWAGPSGMGAPGGQGDWAAMVHDYNYDTNGIRISSYFNPTLSTATSKALIQSNNNLIRNAGGVQSVKMGLFFGTVNAFQWYANSWK